MKMKLGLIAGVFALIALGCANKKDLSVAETDCPPKACTMDFRSVSVIFKDADGDTITVNDYTATLKKDGKKLPSASSENPTASSPYYLVANDADKSALTVEGDTLVIQGTHPVSGEKQLAEMVISGGRCECHINKISGQQEITFN